jgi:hypothetical protein
MWKTVVAFPYPPCTALKYVVQYQLTSQDCRRRPLARQFAAHIANTCDHPACSRRLLSLRMVLIYYRQADRLRVFYLANCDELAADRPVVAGDCAASLA